MVLGSRSSGVFSRCQTTRSRIPDVATFTLTSTDARDGAPFASAHMSGVFGVPGGEDVSPHLSWSGAPDGTKSFAVTMYDPDAPTGAGFWHWAVADIPATVTELPRGAGDKDGSACPPGRFSCATTAAAARYIGAAPPAGHGPHRYFIMVHALDVEAHRGRPDATPANLGFNIFSHSIGRAMIVADRRDSWLTAPRQPAHRWARGRERLTRPGRYIVRAGLPLS